VKALLLALVALLLVQLAIRRKPPLYEQFNRMVPTPDCAPFLDEHLLRPT
jgi:hypothetical protein